MREFDYIIVGAGSAGCVLADRLSAAGGVRVLVLEAGGSDRRLAIRVPIGYGHAFHDPAVNWRFRAEPDPGLAGRSAYVPRGKALGGSSAINAMVWHRGLPGDYDDWRDAGNPGWGWKEAEAAFATVERRIGPGGAVTGAGPQWVEDREADYHPLRRRFLEAAAEAGLPATADMNGAAAEGVGAYALTTRGGWRCSAADAFLRPAMARGGVEVVTGALAARILFDGRRAVGVEARVAGASVAFRARREVVAAAGAVGSPMLLQRSGIGPGALLQRLGIAVLHANEAVGGGLQDHLAVNYAYRATEPTLNQTLGTWPGRIGAAAAFLLRRRGPFSIGVNQMGGLVRSRPGLARADVQLYFNPLSYSAAFAGDRPTLRPDPWPGFILSFSPCRPTSRGRVDLGAPDPDAPPRIAPSYLGTEADVAGVLAGARLIGRLQDTGAMRRLIDGAPPFDLGRATEAAILEDFRARAGSVFHLCGTCRMAPEAAGGVVDARLRVRGVEGLRVVDASILPNATSANTNAPTIMVAARGAALILEDAAERRGRD